MFTYGTAISCTFFSVYINTVRTIFWKEKTNFTYGTSLSSQDSPDFCSAVQTFSSTGITIFMYGTSISWHGFPDLVVSYQIFAMQEEQKFMYGTSIYLLVCFRIYSYGSSKMFYVYLFRTDNLFYLKIGMYVRYKYKTSMNQHGRVLHWYCINIFSNTKNVLIQYGYLTARLQNLTCTEQLF